MRGDGRRAVPLALVAPIALIAPTVASAWALYEGSWAWQRHPVEEPVRLNTTSFPAAIGTEDQVEDAFLAALGTWNNTGDADVWLTYDGRTTEPAGTEDHEVTAAWFDGADPYNPEAVAVALTWYTWGAAPGSPLAQTDCDIRFYAEDGAGPVDWNVGGAPSFIDLQEIATHELGHCLGLDHSEVRDAMMWPLVHNDRLLHPDDQAGLQAVYGPGCADGDRDGSACDDCDDADPDRHPAAPEVCNGVDDDCDGTVDADDPLEVTFGGSTRVSWGQDAAPAGIFRAEADGTLDGFGQDVQLAGPARVTFGVYEASALDQPFVLVRSDFVDAPGSSGVVDSPPLDVPLTGGRYYLLYAVAEGRADYAHAADLDPTPQGDLSPVGSAWANRAPPEELAPLVEAEPPLQVLRLEAPDRDGDGVTTLCGDCDDADPNVRDCDGATGGGTGTFTGGDEPGTEGSAGAGPGCGCALGAPLGVGVVGLVLPLVVFRRAARACSRRPPTPADRRPAPGPDDHSSTPPRERRVH